MLGELFKSLSRALESTPAIALGGSFLWGVISILLSPCHLASIPLVVGFIGEQGRITTRRAAWLAMLFAAGILVTIGLIGLITGLIGRMLGDIGPYGNYIVAAVFLAVGLHFLGIIPLPLLGRSDEPIVKRRGLAAGFLLGLIFGVAMGPCTFAYMAPMLGITFRVAATHFPFAVALLFAYGAGHCSVIVLAGTCTELVQHYLDWNERSKGNLIVKKICGVLLIAGAVYLLLTS